METTTEKSPLMSVGETCDAMRAAGYQISDLFLCFGIQQKVFPFAFGIEGKTWRYYISRVQFWDWIEKQTGESRAAIMEAMEAINEDAV